MIKKLVLTLVAKALQAPIRQITLNAGVDGSVVVGKLLEQNKKNQGYDAQNEEYVDMFTKGIIDPVKVVRTALQDAASIAGLLVTTEAMIADKPDDKDAGGWWNAWWNAWWHGRHGWHGWNGNVIPLFFKKKFKGHLFRWPFFLLSCYKVKICQKDIVENHLKIQVLLKSQN